MDTESDGILLALLKNPNIVEEKQSTFQWVVDSAGIGNRNRCRKLLNKLTEQRLVKEEPEKSYRNGQKKWFSLTEKGKNKGRQLIIDNVNQCFNSLEIVTKSLNPAKVRKEFDSKIDSLWELMVKNKKPFKGKPFNEKVAEFTCRQAEPAKPLFESLRRLHKILSNFRMGDVNYNQYVTIVMNDSDALTIPIRLLKGIDFAGLFFLGLSKNHECEMEWKATLAK